MIDGSTRPPRLIGCFESKETSLRDCDVTTMIICMNASPMDDAHGSPQTFRLLVETAPFMSEQEFEAACDSLAVKYQEGEWNEDSLGLRIQVGTIPEAWAI